MTQLWTRHVELNNLRSTQQAVSCFLSVCQVELKMRVAVASTVSLDTSVCAKCTSSEKRKTRCPLRSWAVSQAPWERQAGAYQLQCHKSNCNSRCESGFSDKAEAVHCASAASRLVLLGHSVHTHTHTPYASIEVPQTTGNGQQMCLGVRRRLSPFASGHLLSRICQSHLQLWWASIIQPPTLAR